MCRTKNVIDPGNLLFGKKTAKYADPLKLTHTAIGDPTGRIRRTRAQIAREDAAEERAKTAGSEVYPRALNDAASDASGSTAMTINERLRRRSAYATSLLGASYSNAYPSLLGSARN